MFNNWKKKEIKIYEYKKSYKKKKKNAYIIFKIIYKIKCNF